jgi:hypothetical protein
MRLRRQTTNRTVWCSKAWNRGWLPLVGDVSWGHFLIMTVNEEPGVDGHFTPILAINYAYISRGNQHKMKRFGLLLIEFHLYMRFI